MRVVLMVALVFLMAAACGDDPVPIVPHSPGSSCGDGFCSSTEDPEICPRDCPIVCGDGFCDRGENVGNCADDCPVLCGDGVCSPGEACASDCEERPPGPECGDGLCESPEDTENCRRDCPVCGDEVCGPGEEDGSCEQDCAGCGDGRCTGDETPETCALDCLICGDGLCSSGEDPLSCPEDCAYCGDGFCTDDENLELCPRDCAWCGDGVCSPTETRSVCPDDCAVCGDRECDGNERSTCPDDCPVCGDGICEGREPTSCPSDCAVGPVCGDGVCEGSEAVTCPRDCESVPECGDGVCSPDEDAETCPADCVRCGDDVCHLGELYDCSADCGPYECGDGVCWVGERLWSCDFDCASGEPFEDEDEPLPIYMFAVSGHCFGPFCRGRNDEYLYEQGTADRVTAYFDRFGFDSLTLDYADSFYNYDEDDHYYAPPTTADWPYQYGFLMLIRDLAEVRDRYVWGVDPRPNIIILCHSHGCVWAHMAAVLLPDLPIDVLISLDGESLGWRGDGLAHALGGDDWRDVIDDWEVRNDVDWPVGLDVSAPADAFSIPGVAARQDVEDVVPDNVIYNLEVSGNFVRGPIRDGDPNHRFDGSERGIRSVMFDEAHDDLDEPYSDSMDWVMEQLADIYGL